MSGRFPRDARDARDAGTTAASRGPVDASMNLLNEVTRRPLDPGYQQAADRRRADGDPPVGVLQRTWLLLAAIVLGLLTAAAATDLRAPEPAAAQARALLERQIADRTAAADDLLDQNAARSAQIAELQTAALGEQDPDVLARLNEDAVSSGTVAVGGPGLRITVQDSAAARENPEEANTDERVQDIDLQIAVNGLWEAGAEAIAINGHRLTAVTAIRGAGSAILVGAIPLSGPYVVESIGDPARLATRFARTAAGQHLAALRNTYGINSAIESEKLLELPGAAQTRLISASAAEPAAPAPPTGTATTSGVASSAPTASDPTAEGGSP